MREKCTERAERTEEGRRKESFEQSEIRIAPETGQQGRKESFEQSEIRIAPETGYKTSQRRGKKEVLSTYFFSGRFWCKVLKINMGFRTLRTFVP